MSLSWLLGQYRNKYGFFQYVTKFVSHVTSILGMATCSRLVSKRDYCCASEIAIVKTAAVKSIMATGLNLP
jgi:hypothetical protein